MAQITINEISQNYTYNIGSNSFATVALPITAMWGPAYMDPDTYITDEAIEDGQSKTALMLEQTSWLHFPATQAGLESFVSTFRGPASNYKLTKDYSYQMAMTLLTAGYDVLVCRVCPGSKAGNDFVLQTAGKTNPKTLSVYAKYPGSFGNSLKVSLSKVSKKKNPYWNLIVYVEDSTGVQTAVENLIFVFDVNNATDTIPHIDEVESNFVEFSTDIIEEPDSVTNSPLRLGTGSDTFRDVEANVALTNAVTYAKVRYTGGNLKDGTNVGQTYTDSCKYIQTLSGLSDVDKVFANTQMNKEWIYTAAYAVYDLLKDKLNYNPQRIISPGWDDQDIRSLQDDATYVKLTEISPLHCKLMEVAYYSRCATGLLDIPRSEKRSCVYNEYIAESEQGYAQSLARISSDWMREDINSMLYTTHCALFAPWGQYKYVGMGKQCIAPPSFLALLIQRAMILNQSLQYEWALPTNRKHNLKIGKMDYKVPKKLLDIWQKLEGVGVNVITDIPELGLSIWGNSTLYEVPPATYQALANLSTRYLVNAVEDVAYKCGLAITFQYNNEQAYNKFYAGVTPTLDTMKNVGAIDDYYVKMAADINGLDQVNANTVIGKIYLVINGVINDIIIDLIALPPETDLNQYKS